MPDKAEKAQMYRERAKKIRSFKEGATEEMQIRLEEMARGCDRIAQSVEPGPPPNSN